MVAEKQCCAEQRVSGIPMRIRVSAYDLTRVLADLARQLDLLSDAPKVVSGDEPSEYFILLVLNT